MACGDCCHRVRHQGPQRVGKDTQQRSLWPRGKDIARTEIGEQNYMFTGQLNGGNAVSIALQQKPGSNAIATMKEIREAMAKLKESFPEDLDWVIPYDATEYVSSCVREIVLTLGITFLLVVIVCYLFLQDWRATLIPCLTIPVYLGRDSNPLHHDVLAIIYK